MPSDRPPVAGQSPASSRSAATNSPSSRWRKNTATGRRCRDLYKAYLKRAGNPADADTQAAILAAAEQTVLAEMARLDLIAGMNGVNLELVIRAENLANRTRKNLGLDKSNSSKKRTGPSLDDIKVRYSAPAAPATGETGA